jgi:hypothetical protein
MRGAGPAAVGRDQRPLWVSCSPTSGGGAPAAAAASSSRRRSPPIDRGALVEHELIGIGARSGWTATASPPQISAAPEPPKRRQRRSVSGDGWPSSVPSQPSIGWMAKRLASRAPPKSSGCASGESGAAAIASSQGRLMPSPAQCARSAAGDLNVAMRG